MRTSIAFIGRMGQSYNTILSLIPAQSNLETGLRYSVYVPRLAEYLGLGEGEVVSLLPEAAEVHRSSSTPGLYWNLGFFRKAEDAHRFLAKLQEVRKGSKTSSTAEGGK